jgi:hypothetical protein
MKMKKQFFTLLLIFLSATMFAQEEKIAPVNASAKLMADTDKRLTIGGYAQIDYNQPVNKGQYNNGNLDVHRMVLMFGYKFNDRAQFITELEVEHVKEIYVEQAFLDYKILPWLNFRGGLMLVPMGIVNEYHEPPTFNGVERPNLDKYIVPSTWREIGMGFTGVVNSASIKYQLYVMNGFNGYDEGGKLRGSDGLRKGRQKGAESFSSSPNLAAKVDYFGISGLKLGLSGYFGDTQSTLYDGLDKDDAAGVAQADSSVVGVSMVGLDARYNISGWEFRGQYNYSNLSNTDQYNEFTGKDLGSALQGYYVEAGYDLFHTSSSISSQLVPFVRYEKYDTHHKTEGGLAQNSAYDRTDITAGISWRATSGVALKADYQWKKTAVADSNTGLFNMGVGIWF